MVVPFECQFIPDVRKPRIERWKFNTARGEKIEADCLVLVDDGANVHVLVALDAQGYKPGTPFGLEGRRGKGGKTLYVYRDYDSLYKLLRAYAKHIKAWVARNAEALGALRTLAQAELLATYGVSILEPHELMRAQSMALVALDGVGDLVSRTEEVEHAIALYRRTTTRKGSRRTLGFASVTANLDLRLADLAHIDVLVVTVGMIVANYIGDVVARVHSERERLDAILTRDDVFTEEASAQLVATAAVLRTVLVARPHTHVGMYAPEDCDEAQRLIDGQLEVSEDARAGASEGVRNRIVAARNALLLLELQYDVEECVLHLTEAINAGAQPNAEEWKALSARLGGFLERILGMTGKRFTRGTDPLPKVLARITSAQWTADHCNQGTPGQQQSALRRVKQHLVLASAAM